MASQDQDNAVSRLAAAWLAQGPSSRACRWVKANVAPETAVDLDGLCAALRIDPPDRTSRINEAVHRARRELVEAGRTGIGLVLWGDAGYPPRLATIDDPPIALWYRGPAPLDGSTIAIVGSRTATPAGLQIARELAGDLAQRGYTIVSGLAAGVDGAAHEAALAVDGLTVAALGCGVDVVYPPRHARLAAAIVARGCLVSEFPPGTQPRGYHFPRRNRVIAGLSRAVVVIEAGLKSGSLITAREALGAGRDVMAVPGTVGTGRSVGCHALIRDGARLVESADDVIEELEGVSAAPRRGARPSPHLLSDLEKMMAPRAAYAIDDLVARTGRPVGELLGALARLELEGRITRNPGGGFVRA